MDNRQIYKRYQKLDEYVNEYLYENEANGIIEIPVRLINEAITGYYEAIKRLHYYEFDKNVLL